MSMSGIGPDRRERTERAVPVDNDTAARALYESAGFSNREGKPDGPVMFFYEREL
jgi:hypothetical protein